MTKKIILASASPRRRELLEQIGLDFDIVISDTDESVIEKTDRIDLYVEELSMLKAASVAEIVKRNGIDDAIIIAADTVVCCDNEILGKPENEEDAKRMLKMLSGRSHEVYTGICVLDIKKGVSVAEYENTTVYFNELTEEKINGYINTKEPFDKAGGYGIQGKGALLVEKINGDYFNVVGLPISRLVKILERDFEQSIF